MSVKLRIEIFGFRNEKGKIIKHPEYYSNGSLYNDTQNPLPTMLWINKNTFVYLQLGKSKISDADKELLLEYLSTLDINYDVIEKENKRAIEMKKIVSEAENNQLISNIKPLGVKFHNGSITIKKAGEKPDYDFRPKSK